MRKLFILLASFLMILSSCNEKVKSQKPVAPKKPIPIVTEPVDPVNQFKYPKSELFLGFYSGMSKNEFHEHAKRLVDKGLLIEGAINGVVNTTSSVTEYSYKIGEPHRAPMKAEFSPEQSYRLVYIKLNISGIHDKYSEKYNIPKLKKSFYRGNEWIVADMKVGSKIGVYNKKYDPKRFLNIKVKTQVGFGLEETKRVTMPKLLIDKSRKLDILEEQVYYDNKIDWAKLQPAEQLVEIDSSNSVLYYRKYWTRESREEFSINKNIASMNIHEQISFSLKYWQETETQSKQVITYIDYLRKTEVIYTTKQYYDEKIKKPIPVPQKPKPKIQRDFLDEI
mgnify:CR=1 FL=1